MPDLSPAGAQVALIADQLTVDDWIALVIQHVPGFHDKFRLMDALEWETGFVPIISLSAEDRLEDLRDEHCEEFGDDPSAEGYEPFLYTLDDCRNAAKNVASFDNHYAHEGITESFRAEVKEVLVERLKISE